MNRITPGQDKAFRLFAERAEVPCNELEPRVARTLMRSRMMLYDGGAYFVLTATGRRVARKRLLRLNYFAANGDRR